ncbi:hypothetical protein WN943_011385 [Citrus x changshan-huyou]
MMAQLLLAPSNREAPTGHLGAAAPILEPASLLVPVRFAFDNDQLAVDFLGHPLRVISDIGLRQDWAQLAEKLFTLEKWLPRECGSGFSICY